MLYTKHLVGNTKDRTHIQITDWWGNQINTSKIVIRAMQGRNSLLGKGITGLTGDRDYT